MIAYYAMTKFHLIFCLTHKILHRQDKEGILFLYSGLAGVEEYKDKILECGIFDEIYVINEIELRQGWIGVKGSEDVETINKNVELLTGRVDEWLPVRLEDMEEIYIANDHWALGMYCVQNHLYYNYYEDGVGMLSKPEYSYELVYKLNKTQAYIANYIGAFGNNEYVLKKYADLENQSEGFYDEKACHYSVKDSLAILSTEDISNVLYIFSAPRIDAGSSKCTLVFTEHFINMKRLSIEGQSEIYTLLCDYFSGENKLLIKPHPNDFHTNYEKLFPGVTIIPKEFPSELIPFCMEGEKELGLAACSTAVLGLQDYFNRIVRFDTDIENTYVKFHRYYAISNFLKMQNINLLEKVGVEETQLLQFLSAVPEALVANGLKHESLTAVLVDKNDTEQPMNTDILDKADCTIFFDLPISETFTYKFWENCKKEHLSLIQLKKECNSVCHLLSCEDEYIYIYTKNKEISERIGGLSFMKDLPYSGAKINIDTISNNDKVKIKFLEACLDSTNKKLQFYIEREKELMDEINKLT